MIVELLTEHHLEFLSLIEGCTGSSESTLAKMPHCWKSHVTAHIIQDTLRLVYLDNLHYNKYQNIYNQSLLTKTTISD